MNSIAVTVENVLKDFEIYIICLVDLFPIDNELHILRNTSTGKSSVICNIFITVFNNFWNISFPIVSETYILENTYKFP